jgi:3-hydroxyacyl-[acyl-carrier-protein] dehydratase
MTTKEILSLLPYSHPFLFVDELHDVSENGVIGSYTYKTDEYFYQGHFKDLPVTPGVILTETMAQIGVVSLGIYLYKDEIAKSQMPEIALTSIEVNFFAAVFPGEKVKVTSHKKYFRFGKLSCNVEMRNNKDKIVCSGNISGVIKKPKNE